jgi:hypothetical protein
MYIAHPVFRESESLKKPIWRYMDFWKFLNLLESKALFFSNSENLGDNFEGRIPSFVLEKIKLKDKETGTDSNDIINHIENICRKTFLVGVTQKESLLLYGKCTQKIDQVLR